jgi:hypothetical protein
LPVTAEAAAPSQAHGDGGGGDARRGQSGVAPHAGQIARCHHRVRRQAVHLGLVEQQEEGSRAADAVVRIRQVELRFRPARVVEFGHP